MKKCGCHRQGKTLLNDIWAENKRKQENESWDTWGKSILGRGYIKDKDPESRVKYGQFEEQQGGQREWDSRMWMCESVAALLRDAWAGLNWGSSKSGRDRDRFTGGFEGRTFKVCLFKRAQEINRSEIKNISVFLQHIVYIFNQANGEGSRP